MNKRKLGGRYEELAAAYLRQKGLKILEQNFRCRVGEIDLIALDHGKMHQTDHDLTIVFVEVKYRRDAASGMPYEAVDLKKRKTICRVADYYRQKAGGLSGYNFRFDIISILGDTITWIPNAFEYLL